MNTVCRLAYLGIILSFLACHPSAVPPSGDPTVEKLSPVVERLRSLRFETDVSVGHVTSSDVRKYLQKRIHEEYSVDELANERRVLVLLKLLPDSFPYEETVVSMMTQEIAGYYDPDVGSLFLSDQLPKAQVNEVVVHELTHALQDQHFKIGKLLKRNRGNDDQTLALSALLEGEAMSVMMDYSGHGSPPEGLLEKAMTDELQRNAAIRDVPKFLIETMVFPYVEGLRFVSAVRKKGRWIAVDAVYERLPKSSAEILHPEIYLKGDAKSASISTELPKSSLQGSVTLTSNVMGEFGVRQVFESPLGAERSRVVAEGWTADRYWLVRNARKEVGLIWQSAWNSEKDADEFTQAWKSVFGEKSACVRKENNRTVSALNAGDRFCDSFRF